MTQRRHHYERAFEHLLRAQRVPYVAVNEARKALLPEGAELTVDDGSGQPRAVKNFDFVVYGSSGNLLIEVKGRKIPRGVYDPAKPPSRGRLECWAQEEDVESLSIWERLFGPGFEGVLVFLYWCDGAPPDGLFEEVFPFEGRWYAPRAIELAAYASRMRVRSPRWRTVDLARADFDRLSAPFTGSWGQRGARAADGGLGGGLDAGPAVPVLGRLGR